MPRPTQDRHRGRGTRKTVVRPFHRRDMAKNAVQHKGVVIRLACEVFRVGESCYRHESRQNAENEAIANWLLRLTDNHRNWGFGLCFLYLRILKTNHLCKLVRAWVVEYKDEIELFYLPSYSPHLNLEERLNAISNRRWASAYRSEPTPSYARPRTILWRCWSKTLSALWTTSRIVVFATRLNTSQGRINSYVLAAIGQALRCGYLPLWQIQSQVQSSRRCDRPQGLPQLCRFPPSATHGDTEAEQKGQTWRCLYQAA